MSDDSIEFVSMVKHKNNFQHVDSCSGWTIFLLSSHCFPSNNKQFWITIGTLPLSELQTNFTGPYSKPSHELMEYQPLVMYSEMALWGESYGLIILMGCKLEANCISKHYQATVFVKLEEMLTNHSCFLHDQSLFIFAAVGTFWHWKIMLFTAEIILICEHLYKFLKDQFYVETMAEHTESADLPCIPSYFWVL